MKKIGKRKSIMLIIITLMVVAAVVVLVYMFPILTMKPASTGKVADSNIISIQNGSNTIYIFETDAGFIAIDAGSNREKLKESLTQLSIDPAKVSHVLLTHADPDHTAGLPLFTNAKIYLSEDEMKMLDGSTKRNIFSYVSLPVEMNKLLPLTDAQELSIGSLSIFTIKTPGHTLGSMSFLINQTYLFTGDAFRVNDKKMQIHPYSMDKDLSAKTILQLSKYIDQCQYVFTTHYGYHLAENLQ